MKNEAPNTIYAWMGYDDEGTYGIAMGLGEHSEFGILPLPLITTIREQALGMLRELAIECNRARDFKGLTLVAFQKHQILDTLGIEEKEKTT